MYVLLRLLSIPTIREIGRSDRTYLPMVFRHLLKDGSCPRPTLYRARRFPTRPTLSFATPTWSSDLGMSKRYGFCLFIHARVGSALLLLCMSIYLNLKPQGYSFHQHERNQGLSLKRQRRVALPLFLFPLAGSPVCCLLASVSVGR